MSGSLYLVSIPIGNYEDITYRAIKILKDSDLIVCEERNEGIKILKHYLIEKPIETLNEHNESVVAPSLLTKLKEGKNISVISDAGTPVFSDPGLTLVNLAIQNNIKIIPIPGASCIMPALIVSGFSIKEFVFAGFLSPKKERRIAELKRLKMDNRTIVLMDTPYRLIQLVRDIADVFNDSRNICVAYNLTMDSEKIFHGKPSHLYKLFLKDNLKGEFVIIIDEFKGNKRYKN